MLANDMTKVFWHGCNESFFQLSGDFDFTRVVLRSVSGLTSQTSRTIRGRSDGRGGDVQGMTIEVMTGSLAVEILPGVDQTLAEVWEEWKSSWSTNADRQGLLEVITHTGAWSVPAILDSNIEVPSPGPSSPGLVQFSSSVSVLALDGVWSGEHLDYTGAGGFQVPNIGTVDMHPVVYWSGSGQSVTLPDGRTINLPSVVGEHRISLDPDQGFKVWGPDGSTRVDVWAAFRGLDLRAPIPPDDFRVFKTSAGCFVRATPLHENPWG